MVKVASKKFSNMGVRMHGNLENSLIEVGRAHLKNGRGELHATHLIELLSQLKTLKESTYSQLNIA